ncbi:DMT family transporter [Luedemannella flava]
MGFDVRGGDLWAVAQIAIVVVGYAVGPYILNRHLSGAPGLGVIAASLGVTALIYLPVAVVQAPRVMPSATAVGAVVGLALICTALAFVVFFALIAEVGPVRATVVTYVNPAVAVALGVLLLGEPLTAGILLGFALVLAGSVLATRRGRPEPAVAPVAVEAECATG